MAQKGANAQAALIKNTPFTEEDGGPDLRRILPAWIISGVIHVALLSLLLLWSGFRAAASNNPDKVETVVENKVDDDETYKDKNLTNDELGNDPDSPTNYNVDRIDPEVSVPGPVDPSQTVGILGAPMDAPPATVAPPPGFGGGQGGGVDSDKNGTGGMLGFAGGVGGSKLIPGGMGGRSGATREKMLKEGGGNSASEAAVAGGLKWLVRHQFADGHWGMHNFAEANNKCNCGNPGAAGHEVAGTGFGLLPMLAAGETHRAVGKNNMYAKNVEKGLNWLCQHQAADGQLGDGYSHPIATIVLCEAYGLTSDPAIKPHAQRAINKIVDWQAADGGFRYGPKQAGDTSVTGWHVQALKSAQMAGLNVPQATMTGVNQFLDKVQSDEGSRYGYTTDKDVNLRMVSVGLLLRQYTGWGPRSRGLTKGMEYLQKTPPGPNPRDIYYFYYATQVMHHMGAVAPEAWDKWNVPMRNMLIETQDKGANADKRDQKGSWDPTGDVFSAQLGRLGYTSLCMLTLEVYYRHLPLYRRELGAQKDAAILNR